MTTIGPCFDSNLTDSLKNILIYLTVIWNIFGLECIFMNQSKSDQDGQKVISFF